MTARSLSVLDALDRLESVLVGDARAQILGEISRNGSPEARLKRLRTQMGAHTFRSTRGPVELDKLVRKLDNRTRQDGFRVLHSWNHTSHRFTDDIVPVLLLDFYQRARPGRPGEAVTLQILLDYYFLHVLSLCAVRAWDVGDPDANLDTVTRLLAALQGSDGSGHNFVADGETLLIYALSQFHPEEQAYDRLIEKVRRLSRPHRLTFARVSAAVLSAHLRWGFWLMYERDAIRMRRDNVGDYPWLLHSVLTLMRAWAETKAGPEKDDLAEGLLLGLAADPWVFTGKAPPALADYEEEHAELRGLLETHGVTLLAELKARPPAKDTYSPLSLHFNFPHNALVGIVTLALLEEKPQAIALNALFTSAPSDDHDALESREKLARTLMAFSRGSPDRLGRRGAMLVAYDPLSALRTFTLTVDSIRKGLG